MSVTIELEKKHFPVLLNELISIISPLYGGTFLDCTFGQGGYSKKILEKEINKVIAIDRDEEVYINAKKLEKKFKNRFNFQNIKFSQINKIKTNDLKAIIFDLGYSTNQIKDLRRGLSFKSTGRLNMQMGLNNFSCHEVISNMDEINLYKIFKYYGDEKYSKKIARKIVEIRKTKIINTEDLTKIIDSVKKFKNTKINNSTKVFQALRIFVNKEISELINGLINAFNLIPVGGTIIVVTFHSIEDRIVKFFFKNYSETNNTSRYAPIKQNNIKYFNLQNKKPITPSIEELKLNPPSRSAKLRFAVKTNNECNFEEFIQKFKPLLDIENLKINK
ncbi:MAG: 16S rRNA (cytosine(1402)-N(4))-methyltransferase RsmH [Candidatus Pelagibacter sp.]